jgi:hypothetical protein
MAFFKEYGRPEGDQGEWFDIPAQDSERVRLRIRRIPFELGMKLESRYGREELVVNKAGFKRPQRVHTGDEEISILNDKASWAWVGCEGLTVEIADDEAAAQWSQLLNEPVSAGQTVSLDGRLSEPIKRRLFGKDLDLAVWILKRADEIGKRYKTRQERLSGN